MPPKYKSNKRVHDSSDDDEQAAKRSKVSTESKKDAEGNTFWELSNARRVQVSDFKGKRLIGIREFYQKDGQFLPGKKGISLTVEQFSALVNVLPQLVNHLSDLGDSVPLPSFRQASKGTPADVSDDDGSDASGNKQEHLKANHEVTSDEE